MVSSSPSVVSLDKAKNVLESLSKHILVDGYHMVMDLRASRGNFIHDSLQGVEILDFFSHFATCPIGYAHPKLTTPEFLDELAWTAVTKPANSDIYTEQMASFVETFARLGVPSTHSAHMFFVEGGALANENALKAAFDWKVRRNFKKGYRREVGSKILHFEQAFHGRSGYTLSLTNTSDPRKTMYFPKFDWPRVVNPKLTFPLTEESLAATIALENLSIAQIERALAENPDAIAAPNSSRSCAHSATSTRCCSSSTRCRPAWASPARCGPSRVSASRPISSPSARRRRSAAVSYTHLTLPTIYSV